MSVNSLVYFQRQDTAHPADLEQLIQALLVQAAIPTAPASNPAAYCAYPLMLSVEGGGLQLTDQRQPKQSPVFVDFDSAALRHRLAYGGGKSQMLARALGLHRGRKPDVLDATAGLGVDSFLLASWGCRVQLCERSPVMHALLADGLRRGLVKPGLQSVLKQMQLRFGDACQFITEGQLIAPEVVYLDPMFPDTGSRALSKKVMRLLHELVGQDLDAAALLAAARGFAKQRVVVKRPRLAPPIADQQPSYQLTGKANRFDIYLCDVKPG